MSDARTRVVEGGSLVVRRFPPRGGAAGGAPARTGTDDRRGPLWQAVTGLWNLFCAAQEISARMEGTPAARQRDVAMQHWFLDGGGCCG
ncbi:MAG: hypothetical protein HY660_02935 [Armatimonadetes bacterium]|nr:hypothetical protein [Armatimonadota bacterium]